MSLKTFVKIGKIENLSDARYCAGMMADILGFNLEPDTEGFVSPEKFSEISEWISGVKFCGEFGQANISDIKLATTQYKLDYLEVQSIEQLESLTDLGFSLIFKYVVNHRDDIGKMKSVLQLANDLADILVVYATNPELTPEIDSALVNVDLSKPMIRSYGLDMQSASEIAQKDQFYGIELEASPEEQPGFKDYGVVMDILEVLEEE